jgi:hypothetical protein
LKKNVQVGLALSYHFFLDNFGSVPACSLILITAQLQQVLQKSRFLDGNRRQSWLTRDEARRIAANTCSLGSIAFRPASLISAIFSANAAGPGIVERSGLSDHSDFFAEALADAKASVISFSADFWTSVRLSRLARRSPAVWCRLAAANRTNHIPLKPRALSARPASLQRLNWQEKPGSLNA